MTGRFNVGIGSGERDRHLLRIAELQDGLESMVCQFAYWSEGVGGYTTGGLSALEEAFEVLGWEDPHPAPDARCDEPGCMKQPTCGTPKYQGVGAADGGEYRWTCLDHRPKGWPLR
jgi:hypothetical protein